MCAYCCIRFLITSCAHERRMRVVLFITFLFPSTPGNKPTRGKLLDMMPSIPPLDVVLALHLDFIVLVLFTRHASSTSGERSRFFFMPDHYYSSYLTRNVIKLYLQHGFSVSRYTSVILAASIRSIGDTE